MAACRKEVKNKPRKHKFGKMVQSHQPRIHERGKNPADEMAGR